MKRLLLGVFCLFAGFSFVSAFNENYTKERYDEVQDLYQEYLAISGNNNSKRYLLLDELEVYADLYDVAEVRIFVNEQRIVNRGNDIMFGLIDLADKHEYKKVVEGCPEFFNMEKLYTFKELNEHNYNEGVRVCERAKEVSEKVKLREKAKDVDALPAGVEKILGDKLPILKRITLHAINHKKTDQLKKMSEGFELSEDPYTKAIGVYILHVLK